MSCPATQRTFLKDVQQLYRTIDASTDGQASIVGVDELTAKVCLRPKSGLNAHAEFLLTIKCCSTYPMQSPFVSFDSPIFHPNIDPTDGSICLSLLNDWRSCYNLLDVVKGVLYLIDHPAFDSPNNSFGRLSDTAQLSTMTARVLAGVPIKGYRFPPNTAWFKWASDNGCLPTEEEGMEEAEDAAGMRDKVGQKGDEVIGTCTDTAAAEHKASTSETVYAPSDTTSDTVPSFAKMRYLFDPEEDSISWGPYGWEWTPFEVESHWVLIWHPGDDKNMDTYTVFHYIEFLGIDDHRSELGEHYNTLFIGDVLREHQSHPESRQTSSTCPCYGSSLNLGTMFEVKKSVRRTMTTDFCPWSALDGQGINALLGGLFFEVNRRRGDLTCFLDEDLDDDSENQCIRRLFDISSSDNKEAVAVPNELPDIRLPEPDAQSGLSDRVDSLSSESEVMSSREDHTASESDGESENANSSASSSTYRTVCVPYPLITDCTRCMYKYEFLREAINAHLPSVWKWSIRRTRWPIRFAPQQNVDLSMAGIRIPPWRASSGRMMLEICLFCAKNQGMTNLVLLDPMALSPLSSLLNLMHYCELPRPRLTGVLWMTPLDALSPFYRVPIPVDEEQQDGVYDRHEWEDDVYPTPLCLRFLTVTALLTNWVAWMSRVECYAALSMSRFHPRLIIAPVAACLLQPFSLGCGQAPPMDLWPMWMLRRFLILSLRLSQLRFPFFRSSHSCLRYLFPFSDLEEI
ncbi:Ubiquitin-conjugating enzyme E2 A [Taenia solium]|eukprot:TsM_000183500 transcript=TsM_000183500 gene=TsM_000183500